jgi:hypothetical protein
LRGDENSAANDEGLCSCAASPTPPDEAAAGEAEDGAWVVVVAGAGAELLEATRSQEGHMESVVAGRCMYKGFIVLSARSSATSFCNRRFSSVSVSQQRFRYSQSTSVCFSFVLRKDTLLF